MDKVIQLIQITPKELQNLISEGVKTQLQEFLNLYKPKQPNEYLTRSDVAKMFSIDISSVNNWSKKGKLNPLQIGGRIYFLRSDVEASLKPLKV